jgi:hypothetical protein
MRRFIALLSLLTAGSLILAGSTSRAQYPPPLGSVTAGVDSANPLVGSNVLLTCEVRNVSGAPVTGESCIFTIESQPGTDAALGSRSVTTDLQGRATATLYTGTTPGVIVASMRAGALSGAVLVNVQPVSPLPPAAPVEIIPPSTGDAGLAESAS